METIYRISIVLILLGALLTFGAAGASDTGTEIGALYPYIVVGVTSLVLGALGIVALEDVRIKKEKK